MYGIGKEPTDDYGRRCLLARRMVEKGVRFVCVVSGGGPGNMQWDAHEDIEENHLRMAASADQPVAALIKDLKQRGLLDATLVVWGGEFGRSPEAQGGKGPRSPQPRLQHVDGGRRDQRRAASSARPTISGLRAVEKPVHFRDIHTTILNQLGLNQDALSYMHLGRKERLTEVHGDSDQADCLTNRPPRSWNSAMCGMRRAASRFSTASAFL